MVAMGKKCVLSLLFLVGAMHGAKADDIDDFALSPEQLFDATVISASKTSQKLIDAPAAIFVLTNEDIMRSGATSIPEALRLVPGVQVAQVNANSWAIGVRGFNSTLNNKLLVLIDGRAVYDPLFSGVYWDVQDTMLEDIDHIEVIRGPGATLWGANAVDGVINIITKKAKDTQGNLVSATAGNQAKGIVGERYGGQIGDQGYYRVYGKYLNQGDEQTLSSGNAQDGQTAYRSGFRSDWKSSSQNDFTVQGDAYHSKDGGLIPIPTFTSPFSLTQQQNVYANGANILGRWNHTLVDDSHFTLQSYVDYVARDQVVVNDRRTTFDLDSQYELPAFGRHKFVFGAGYRYNDDELTSSPLATFSDEHGDTQLFNGFAQDTITLDPNTWFLTLGSKLEHNDYTGFEIEPSARLQWAPDATQRVWAAVSRAVRTPSRLERDLTINAGVLSAGGTPDEFVLVPNPDFQSERLVAYELGYRNQLTPKLLLDTALFYNDYSQLGTATVLSPSVIATPVSHLYSPVIVTNDTHGETHGFETMLDWRALDNWNLSGSYSFLSMNLETTPSPSAVLAVSEISQQQSPQHQFNLRSQWDITSDTSFDVMSYYVSSLPGFPVGSYWRLDTRLSWRVTDNLQLSLVGQNLLHDEHQEFNSPTNVIATQIGRSVLGNITWRY